MVIIMEECEAFEDNMRLLKDLAKYQYMDKFIQALVEGKTAVGGLDIGVTVGGHSYRLRYGGVQNEDECNACIEALKHLPRGQRQIAQDSGYIRWDMFEHELYINLDVIPKVDIHG